MSKSDDIKKVIAAMMEKQDDLKQESLELQDRLEEIQDQKGDLHQQITDKTCELALSILAEKELDWCTQCLVIAPRGDFSMFWIKGQGTHSGGYEGGDYAFHKFSKLHRLCPVCSQKARDKHGQVGKWDSQAKDQTSYYAFEVQRTELGSLAARVFGVVQKVPEDLKLKEIPSAVIDEVLRRKS